jgi:hypothetical protein
LKNIRKIHIAVIIFAVICFLTFAGVVGYYLYVKNLSERKKAESEPAPEGALLDMCESFRDIYGFSFVATVSGEGLENILPVWALTFTQNPETLYISGTVYGSGALICISTNEITDSVSEEEGGIMLTVLMDESGFYLTNPSELKYSFVSEENYDSFDTSIGENAVYLGSGAKGREVISSLYSTIYSLGISPNVKTGVSEDGYPAFSLKNGFGAENGFVTDMLFNLPENFSAYEISSESGVKGFELYGYGTGLEISLVLGENGKYVKSESLGNYITLEEFLGILGI